MKTISKMRLARLSAGLSLDELAQACKLDRSLLSRAERSFYHLTSDQKRQIAAALCLPEDELFPVPKESK
jgi:transcriptional regulator with XRE-family HTH domain